MIHDRDLNFGVAWEGGLEYAYSHLAVYVVYEPGPGDWRWRADVEQEEAERVKKAAERVKKAAEGGALYVGRDVEVEQEVAQKLEERFLVRPRWRRQQAWSARAKDAFPLSSWLRERKSGHASKRKRYTKTSYWEAHWYTKTRFEEHTEDESDSVPN